MVLAALAPNPQGGKHDTHWCLKNVTRYKFYRLIPVKKESQQLGDRLSFRVRTHFPLGPKNRWSHREEFHGKRVNFLRTSLLQGLAKGSTRPLDVANNGPPHLLNGTLNRNDVTRYSSLTI